MSFIISWKASGSKIFNFHSQERVIIDLVHLRAQFHDWTDIRTQTILKLRSIAEYVDTVSHRTGVAKIVGSGGGALAGGLTLIGGALTIASMGVAFPVLLAGEGS